ncbi:hypothetical protein ACFQFH_15185 [Halobaculum halobium]|uniref:hypothetical protein n=1 Tax=Halobaculum halobium TaxID=3032281 RepID=UPI003612C026
MVFRFPGIKQPSVRWKAMARLGHPNAYLANSRATASRVKKWLDIQVQDVVYPGVDLTMFSPSADPVFDEELVAVLYVGRLDEGKGLFELLNAQARLGDRTDSISSVMGRWRTIFKQRFEISISRTT